MKVVSIVAGTRERCASNVSFLLYRTRPDMSNLIIRSGTGGGDYEDSGRIRRGSGGRSNRQGPSGTEAHKLG